MSELFAQGFEAVANIFWLVFLVVLALIARDFWMTRVVTNYIRNMQWVLLELVIPKENIKPTKAMEQVLSALYGVYSFGLRRWEKYIQGKVEAWISLEMVGHAHSIHFYVRVPARSRNMVEAAFLSQYPDMEIREVEDYTRELPPDLPNDEYEVFGTDIVLARDDVYPIKTYVDFEEEADDEDKNVDPMAIIAEAMSNLKGSERIWLQLLIRPVGRDWAEKGKDVIEELAGRKQKAAKKGFVSSIGEFIKNLVEAPLKHPEWSEGGKESAVQVRFYTPGEQDILKAVQRKISKRAFEAILRFVYIDKRDSFTSSNVGAVMGGIQQYATLNLNFLRPNSKTFPSMTTVTKIPIKPLRKRLVEKRKKQIYKAYRERAMPQQSLPQFLARMKTSILNIEEVATLYHPPTVSVKASKLQPVEARKAAPPVNLPVRRKEQ